MWPIKTVLVATDFSEVSNDAHDAACAIARHNEARLIVLHVAEKPVVSYIAQASELSNEELQQKLWETLRWPREQESGLHVEHRIVEGEPVKEIVRAAHDHHVDLLVMGASGRTGALRWFTGSVTDDVARDAPCSVLLVKPIRAPVAAQEKTAEAHEEPVAEPARAAPSPQRPRPAEKPVPAMAARGTTAWEGSGLERAAVKGATDPMKAGNAGP